MSGCDCLPARLSWMYASCGTIALIRRIRAVVTRHVYSAMLWGLGNLTPIGCARSCWVALLPTKQSSLGGTDTAAGGEWTSQLFGRHGVRW